MKSDFSKVLTVLRDFRAELERDAMRSIRNGRAATDGLAALGGIDALDSFERRLTYRFGSFVALEAGLEVIARHLEDSAAVPGKGARR